MYSLGIPLSSSVVLGVVYVSKVCTRARYHKVENFGRGYTGFHLEGGGGALGFPSPPPPPKQFMCIH